MMASRIKAAHAARPWGRACSQAARPAVRRLADRGSNRGGHRFGCAAPDISFQSSSGWDIAGAKAFGFRCVWVNRTGAADEYPDLAPDRGRPHETALGAEPGPP